MQDRRLGPLTEGTTALYTVAAVWADIDGDDDPAATLRSSYNVASITDNGTGDYTLTYQRALANATYLVAGLTTGTGAESAKHGGTIVHATTGQTTTSVRIKTVNTDANAADADYNSLVVIARR